MIPINEHPTLFAMPLLPPPGILSSGEQPSSNLWRPKYKAIINRDEVRKLLAGYNEDVVVSVGRQNAHVWCRVLAKIAHSYTVAECGINSFRPYLLDIILERPVVSAFYWIGGDMENHVREPHIHTAALYATNIRGMTMFTVRLRLFAFLGAPVYWVVVGEAQGAPVIAPA
ncbi:MAG: hypothetical protein WAN86_25040 [Hyphomicrobiaceae bacterium]